MSRELPPETPGYWWDHFIITGWAVHVDMQGKYIKSGWIRAGEQEALLYEPAGLNTLI